VTTRTEKIRKLRALGRSPNPHEAASALEMARKLEARAITAKGAALAIASLFEARGLTVRVRRHNAPWAGQGERRAFNVEISYRVSKAKVFRPRRDLKIDIVEFGA
jgi:hypothetical protein